MGEAARPLTVCVFQASLLSITPTSSPKTIPETSTLKFGHTFTDHMLTCKWSRERGWEAPEIKAYGPLAMDPASTVLHYSSTLFEGMKAYKVGSQICGAGTGADRSTAGQERRRPALPARHELCQVEQIRCPFGFPCMCNSCNREYWC